MSFKIVFFFITSMCNLCLIISLPSTTEYIERKTELSSSDDSFNLAVINNATIRNVNNANRSLRRVKRASPLAEKFAVAADITQLRMFQMFFAVCLNIFRASALGGFQPLNPEAAVPLIHHYKMKLLDTLTPQEADEIRQQKMALMMG